MFPILLIPRSAQLFLSAAQGQRPRKYFSCCWIFLLHYSIGLHYLFFFDLSILSFTQLPHCSHSLSSLSLFLFLLPLSLVISSLSSFALSQSQSLSPCHSSLFIPISVPPPSLSLSLLLLRFSTYLR